MHLISKEKLEIHRAKVAKYNINFVLIKKVDIIYSV
jgi:hypothetical protein